jgi:hypothetical protein
MRFWLSFGMTPEEAEKERSQKLNFAPTGDDATHALANE